MVGVVGQLLSDLEIIYKDLNERLEAGYDVYRVQLSFIQSRIERHEAEFVSLTKRVRDAEDALKRLMNDPEMDLSKDVGKGSQVLQSLICYPTCQGLLSP